MFNNFPVLSRVIGFLVFPIFVVILALIFELYNSVPDYNAKVLVRDLDSEVTITRDKKGIPFIQGKSDRDVFFAMGYVQAQDRLWQMETQRRLAQGRLSEIFGRDSLDSDIWMRTLGLYPAAGEAWKHLSHDAQQAIEAYAGGVNTWLEGNNQLQPEFDIFQHKPEPWTPVDTLAVAKLFALMLGVNYNLELERQLAQALLPSTYFESLYSEVTNSHRTGKNDLAGLANLLAIREEIKEKYLVSEKHSGSNAWVISSKFTASGQPILANDPHLALQIPSFWYAARLQGNRIRASGMTLVGVPIIILGGNDSIAWGGTALPADTQDLVAEVLSSESPHLYQYKDEWIEFSVREETIHIAGNFPKFLQKKIKPIKLKIRTTRNGPIVSDILGPNQQALSLRWTALDKADTTFEALFRLNYATDWNSFRNALSYHIAPTLNMLYADKNGNIGFSAVGRIPIRRETNGMMPSEREVFDWPSYIEWDHMPKQLNPSSGYIVNANNQMIDSNYPYFISNEWAPPARADRIVQLLDSQIEKQKKIDVNYVLGMQVDVVDLNAIAFIEVMKAVLSERNQEESFAELFQWNGDMHADSHAPALYVSLLKNLRTELYLDEYTKYYTPNNLESRVRSIVNKIGVQEISRTITDTPFWCDIVTTKRIESCKDILIAALGKAKHELERLAGTSPKGWRWKHILKKTYAHRPLSSINFVKGLFTRETSGDGTPDTINVAGYYYDESEGYIENFGAGFRQVLELNSEIDQYLSNSTGQSGHVFSDYYDNTIAFSAINAIYNIRTADALHVTTLTPETETTTPQGDQ